MKNGIFKKTTIIMICSCLSYASFSAFAENVGSNPFKPQVVKSPVVENNIAPTNVVGQRMHQALTNEQDFLNGSTQPIVETVVELSEKDLRQKKLLEEINKKMGKAKNIPVENSRYIGIINGKRVYQDNDTLEYVKVEIND